MYSFGWLRADPLRDNVAGSFNLFVGATLLVWAFKAEARAPGDQLPMRLPDNAQQQVDADFDPEADDGEPAWTRDDVSPFERGPEITEIR